MVSLSPLPPVAFSQKELIPSAKFQSVFASIPESEPELREHEFCLTTNELDQVKTLDIMKRKLLVGNALLSVSTFYGLNVFAARGKKNRQTLSYIIMIDNSLRVQMFWKEIQKIISKFSSKDDAFKEIKSFILEQSEQFWSSLNFWSRKDRCYKTPKEWKEESVQKLEDEVFKTKLSWLSTQKRYERIKSVFDAGYFVFKRIDLRDSTNARALSQVNNQLGIILDTVYISNIPEWVEAKGHLPFFYDAINELRQSMTNQTLLIDTKTRPTRSRPLEQRVRCGIRTANLRKSFPPSFQSSEFALSSVNVTSSGIKLSYSIAPLCQRKIESLEVKSNSVITPMATFNASNEYRGKKRFSIVRKCSLWATLAFLVTPLQKCRDCFSRYHPDRKNSE